MDTTKRILVAVAMLVGIGGCDAAMGADSTRTFTLTGVNWSCDGSMTTVLRAGASRVDLSGTVDCAGPAVSFTGSLAGWVEPTGRTFLTFSAAPGYVEVLGTAMDGKLHDAPAAVFGKVATFTEH